MFFDIRLWQFTRGVRLRIAATVVMGVLASLAGMGRLALLGWLLARVFAGDTFSELLLPFALVAAVMVLRGWIEHTRAMVAHRTAAMVQLVLRKRLYAKVSAGMRRAACDTRRRIAGSRRSSWTRCRASPRHSQGVRSGKRARPAAGGARARGLPQHDVGARDQRGIGKTTGRSALMGEY